MVEREKMTEAVWFRVESTRLARWKEAIELSGERDSNFYRQAVDDMVELVLAKAQLAAEGAKR